MKDSSRISDDRKWQAVVNCDRNYDGIFFYGVKTTGIFCKPSCKSKTPVRENVNFFAHTAEALKHGFRPCKRCCPNKDVFEPELELVGQAKDIINADYNQQIDISYIAKQLGVSKNHLIRLFKRHSEFTPTQYFTKVRVGKARELLDQEDLSILELAYAVGFKSLSNFYKCFKEQTGRTPHEYRKRRDDDSDDLLL
ncbi:MAG: AraC family transcriptional regulator [Firmicutes bacterium]|nr:AraC family transcriptional regulator [Bacillota bacterium]